MKKLVSCATVALFSVVAYAADEATLQKVLSSATVDFNEDGGFDRVVLVEGDDDADIYIFLSNFNRSSMQYESKLALKKEAFVFSGGMWGQQPSLEVAGNGSLIVKSMNESVGRARWELTLTVVYRHFEFLVAGITYSYRDTVDPEAGGNCDLNLLTGKGTRNDKPVKVTTKVINVADWSEERLPEACQF